MGHTSARQQKICPPVSTTSRDRQNAGRLEAPTCKQNSREIASGETVTVANGQKPIVVVPVIIPPIQIEVTLRTVTPEVRNVTVAVNLTGRTLCEIPSMPLPLEYS